MRRVGALLMPSALYAASAGITAAAMRRLVAPEEPWASILPALVAILIAMWTIRLVPRRSARAALVVAVGVLAAAAVVGDRRGLWPPGDALRGPSGLLGADGYPASLGRALGELVRAWTQVIYPADAGEADGAAAARLLAVLLVVVIGAALIAFRAPLLAVAAMAVSVAISTLFVETSHVVPVSVGLAGVAVLLLALGGGSGGGRRLTGVVAAGALVAAASLAALATPLDASAPSWDWRSWSLEAPEAASVDVVWGQSLRGIAFDGDPVPVLEVRGGTPGYLRVAVLERFDGVRWEPGAARGGVVVRASEVELPPSALSPAARSGRLREELVAIRNVGLAADGLPLPIGATAARGLPSASLPAQVDAQGLVRLAAPLPVGAGYEATAVRAVVTPEALDADGLDGAGLAELLGPLLPLTGRQADGDGVAPWRTGIRGRVVEGTDGVVGAPGPFGADYDDRPPRVVDVDATAPAVLDPALVTVAGVAFPAFGQEGRERRVERILQGATGGRAARELAGSGWLSAYREARRLTRDAETPYQAVILLEDRFQTEFAYDETADYLSGSPVGPLPSFLLSPERRGHCQYFAGSMAVLLRMLGIPARVAVGFTPGEAVGDRRVITNRDAHAWVEVRFPRAGWVAFEPTPSRVLPEATSSTSPSFAQSAAGGGGAALAGLVEAGDPLGPGGPNRGTPTGGPVDGAAVAGGAGGGATSPWVGRVGLAVALLALGLLAVWAAKALGTRRALRIDDPRRGAEALKATVVGFLADQGAVAAGASARRAADAADRALGVDATEWEQALATARFGPPDGGRAALREARRETQDLLGRMRGRLDRRERLRGAVRIRRPRRR